MARDRIHLPGIDRDAARVLIDEITSLKDELARLKRTAGRAGIVTTSTPAAPGEFLNIEGPAEMITITLQEPRQSLRNARVTLAFRNSNPVRIVAVRGTVNGEAFVLNDRPGTYDAVCDGIGGWAVQVGVSEEGSGAGGGGGGFSPTYGVPVSVGLANSEGVATTLARSDHVHRDNIATGSDAGYLSRRIYANASSSRVGTTFMGVTVQAAPASFTSISDFADGGRFRIGLASAAGSAACGARGTATAASGSNPGGGGGAFREFWLSRAELVTLLAAGNIAVAVGLGGAAVTGPTSSATSYTACTQGNSGSGPTTFGPWSVFQGGGANGGGASASARAGGAGGGWLSAGGGGLAAATATTGGGPSPGVATATSAVNTTAWSTYGGGSCLSQGGVSGAIGGGSIWGGAAGSTQAATADDPQRGGDSEHGGAGGGTGGRANGAGAGVGGDGGLTGGRTSRATGGSASAGAGARTGGNGGNGADATDVWRGMGNGGAGGGAASSSNAAATGGNGGNGGFPGGASGAGGTAVAQAVGQTSTGGNSGTAGDGLLIIESYI